jgi:hypothetical protein
MKYFIYGTIYYSLQLMYVVWNFKIDNYTFKEYLNDVENFNYDSNYV